VYHKVGEAAMFTMNTHKINSLAAVIHLLNNNRQSELRAG